MRRLVLALSVLLLLTGTTAVVWSGLNLVPLRFLWRHGPTPACEPTGEVITVQDVEFVVIGRGCFRMGSNATGKPGSVVGRFCQPVGIGWGVPVEASNEMPVHWVEFRERFGIARTEITNAQYERFDPEHPRGKYSKGDQYPVVRVSWSDALHYCRWLSERSGRGVLLPSEAMLEAACRAGTETRYAFGDTASALGSYAWFTANSGGRLHEVAGKDPNPWGLYDLPGNVWEWGLDLWHGSYRVVSPATEGDEVCVRPQLQIAPVDGSAWGTGVGPGMVVRGGAWNFRAEHCRSAFRAWWDPTDDCPMVGFRPALTLPPDR